MKKKYMLIAQINNEAIEINWEKITSFESFKKGKYKLQNIDFFTSHYKNHEHLLTVLINNGCLTLNQLYKAKIMIIELKQQINSTTNNHPLKTNQSQNNSLELIYKRSQKYFLEDYQIICLLYNLLNDFEFIKLLYKYYVTEGEYNLQAIKILNSQINQVNEKIYKGNEKLKGLYIGLIKERNRLNESYLLLNQIYDYSKAITQNIDMSLKNRNLAEAYIEEFFLREKYYVIGCKQGIYEKRILSYKVNPNQEKCINDLQFHKFLALIQSYLKSKEDSNINSQHSKKITNDYEIPGQLKLF